MTKILQAIHEGDLEINGVIIPCCVLEDGTRVLSLRGLQKSIGLSEGGGKGGARKIPQLMANLAEKGIDTRDLEARANSPLHYMPIKGKKTATGYNAMILPDVCAVLINASRKGKLSRLQEHLGEQAALAQHGFATIGIIGLVDEATGYEEVRKKGELSNILKDWMLQERYRQWTPTFPLSFYELMFKLKGWNLLNPKLERPSVVGKYTNDIVYERLAPGLLEELRIKNPLTEKGTRKSKHHQWLTPDIGHPRLLSHLEGVMALMRASSSWESFKRSLQRAYPKLNSNLEFNLDDD